MKHILDLCISRFNAFSRLQGELDRAKSALEERKVIDRAKGILMKAKQLTEEQAYALMRKTAMNENKKIVEIAQSHAVRSGVDRLLFHRDVGRWRSFAERQRRRARS